MKFLFTMGQAPRSGADVARVRRVSTSAGSLAISASAGGHGLTTTFLVRPPI